jgi:hypothetical protein
LVTSLVTFFYDFGMRERDWVDYLQASAGPIIAIGGVLIAWQQHKLNHRKRKDELFDKRYAFYQSVVRVHLGTWPGHNSRDDRELELEDVIDMSIEGRYLFGEEVQNLILKLPEMSASNPNWADSEVSKPFDKYLLFEDKSSWIFRKIKEVFTPIPTEE